jgi:hypothetical protein
MKTIGALTLKKMSEKLIKKLRDKEQRKNENKIKKHETD